MGKVKYLSEIREFFKKSQIVDINSLKKFILKRDKRYVNLVVHNLIKKGEIRRITKGYYSIHDDPSLIVFCFKPAYLGLQDALSFHNLWEQETNPVILTTSNVRTGVRKVFGRNVVFRRIKPDYFFGFDYVRDGDFYVPYSDIEKTFIDMVVFNEHMDNEVLKEFKKRIDRKKLKDYLKRYPKNIRYRVEKKIGLLKMGRR
jgi:predicted transcriptional regulator of viral defense system